MNPILYVLSGLVTGALYDVAIRAFSKVAGDAHAIAEVGNMSVSRKYDAIFEKHRGQLPLAFVRSLAKKESNLNPESWRGKAGSARGILQVIPTVLDGYNERHKTTYKRDDLFNPEVCTMIACDLLNRIITAYNKHPALQFNPEDKRYMQLLVWGWNAGYSEAAGVGYVVGTMEKSGISSERITIDTAYQAASNLPKASKWLKVPEKVSWCKGVVSLYEKEQRINVNVATISAPKTGASLALGTLAVGTLALLAKKGRNSR